MIRKLIFNFFIYTSVVLLIFSCKTQTVIKEKLFSPKTEFRGVWVQTAWQKQYSQMNTVELKKYFSSMIDLFDKIGINAVIFQIRSEADAFYNSSIEPRSRLLAKDKDNVFLDSDFDPMKFIIEECHKRGIEFHAWLNPYRAKCNLTSKLDSSHIYNKFPKRFITYGRSVYFDPGIPENIDYICSIVKDIVSRYDVDAINMDDYFYPYPIKGLDFPDDNSFQTYGKLKGFKDKSDWRRHNINNLIQDVRKTIKDIKPWVRFGISPFGIYRNKKCDKKGSETDGLQNYDDLYADVKLWLKEGWIDYNIPQLYWENNNPYADYKILLKWWNNNSFNKQLYIGQDLKKSLDNKELYLKILQSREMKFVKGNCFWYGSLIKDNYSNVTELIKNTIYKNKALLPAYTDLYKGIPDKVTNLKDIYTSHLHYISWSSNKDKCNPKTAQKFVIYRFNKGQKININSSENIISITPNHYYILPYEGGKKQYVYIVTSLDAFNNESKAVKIKVSI